MPKPVTAIDKNKARGQWVMFPDTLPNGRFRGFENRDNITQLRGAWVIGENVSFARTSLPTPRNGFEVLGTEASDATPVRRAWTFETRAGVIWELKAYATGVYYWLVGTSTDWALLKGSFTTGLEFGFANIGESAGEFHSFFCNETDEWFQFNGMSGSVSSVTGSTIVFTDTIANLGFYTTGTRSVIIAGAEYDYTGQAGSTLTGVTPDPSAAGVVAGNLAVQSPRSVAALTTVKSRVALAHDGRIHARSGTRKDVWNYSKLDDPDDFTTGSTDGDGGAKAIEFSGPILAFMNINKSIVAGKRGLLKLLQFTQSGTRIDVPFYQTLTPADDKSTSIGVTNQRSTFASPFGPVFVTQDKRLMLLSGVTANSEPQYLVISDPIQPIFDAGDHTDAAGICVDNIIYYSFKSDPDVSANDTVLVGDMTKQTFDSNGRVLPIQWDTPYIGWNVKDWTSIYNSATGENEVHFHSSLNSSSYKVIDDNLDATNAFTATARSWAEVFDNPQYQKRIDLVYLEVRMREVTELLATLLYDNDGFTAIEEYTLTGDSSDYRFTLTEYNPFGSGAFGTRKFGSKSAVDDTDTYIFYIETAANTFFFNISLQLSVSGAAHLFELVRFGYRLAEVIVEPPYDLRKGIT